MNDKAVQTHDPLGAAYLLQLQALAFEISVAMDAIAANAVTSFQESVAKQEMLLGVLANMAKTIREKVRSSEQPLLVLSDSSIELRIRAASEAIRETEFAVCRAAQALRPVHCSSRFIVQKPYRSIPGGSRAQVEASDLVLRDVTYVLSEQRTQHRRTIPGR